MQTSFTLVIFLIAQFMMNLCGNMSPYIDYVTGDKKKKRPTK